MVYFLFSLATIRDGFPDVFSSPMQKLFLPDFTFSYLPNCFGIWVSNACDAGAGLHGRMETKQLGKRK